MKLHSSIRSHSCKFTQPSHMQNCPLGSYSPCSMYLLQQWSPATSPSLYTSKSFLTNDCQIMCFRSGCSSYAHALSQCLWVGVVSYSFVNLLPLGENQLHLEWNICIFTYRRRTPELKTTEYKTWAWQVHYTIGSRQKHEIKQWPQKSNNDMCEH